MKASIYVEGGAKDSKALRISCQNGFSKLFNNCGYDTQLVHVVACGGRGNTYKRFKTAHATEKTSFIVLLVDSEDPVADITKPWKHLKERNGDNWDRPTQASDEQVFLMTTCMETWIVADHATLQEHFHASQSAKIKRTPQPINVSQLPSLHALEEKHRDGVFDQLLRATSHCSNGYKKGTTSFELLGKLKPCTLRQTLPSFKRIMDILDKILDCPHILCPDEIQDTNNDSD